MNLFHAVIFGIVEGITEFLPVSSTGHLILTADVLGIPHTEFLKTFEIAIQLGAILSVVVLYWRSFFVDKKTRHRVILAFIPTAIVGLLGYKFAREQLLGNSAVVIWSLLLGGIFLVMFELLYKEVEEVITEKDRISSGKAIIIGLFQAIAIVPGVSRSAATICGGLMLGLKRNVICEFSFLLAVPTMLAAAGADLIKSGRLFTMDEYMILATGFLVSFVVAMAGIKFLLGFIKRNNFIPFGVYRVILATIFLFMK
ncbi:MAG: undecaprenyl-diphosphate phosphatase [Candidatus Omnitrophica bacterium]|nr:undecaprenyl-diphosphate phosphatase [Candidatus Omnitrophota bacterium]